MKKVTLVLGLALALFSFKSSETATWTIDPVHTRVGFGITHLGINEVIGYFTKYEAKVTASKEDFSDAQFELSGDVASVSTGFDGLDGHLKAADMMDAAATPKFTFKSTSVTSKGGKNLEVKGDLTLHGITKPVTLDATFNGSLVHPMSKKNVAGFKLTGKINRKDFNVGKDLPDMVASDIVTINATTEFAKN
ncbi:MAG: YceI family protein [Crocinitomicaceae bacterium]|jgi:polyisoprenoid-binding protein YceI